MKSLFVALVFLCFAVTPLHADEAVPLVQDDGALLEQLSDEDLEMLQMIELLELFDLLGDIDTLTRLEDES